MDGPAPRVVVAVTTDDTPYCATGPELAADRLFSLGASAVSELDRTGPAGPVGHAGPVRLVADLPADALERIGAPYEVLERDPSWEGGWRDHATAVTAGERIVVRPEWVAPEPEHGGRLEVVVDAADSFGSGSHPSTRLCLAAVERFVEPGDRVLDVGSGTGVLGVAALLLGGGSLTAIDVAAAAVAATRRTAGLNHVEDRLVDVSDRAIGAVVADHGPFDLVLANLLIPVIEDLGDSLATAVAPGGHVVLSGLLAPPSDQVDRAIAALGAGHDVVGRNVDDGWAAVVLRATAEPTA